APCGRLHSATTLLVRLPHPAADHRVLVRPPVPPARPRGLLARRRGLGENAALSVMSTPEAKARALFGDYSRRSNAALHAPERADFDALAGAFADHFVGASPAGVMGGGKDASFPEILR